MVIKEGGMEEEQVQYPTTLTLKNCPTLHGISAEKWFGLEVLLFIACMGELHHQQVYIYLTI